MALVGMAPGPAALLRRNGRPVPGRDSGAPL